ncbi:MAG: ATP-binding protein, partial [Cyanobacteria bacterium J06648_11]
LLDTPLNEEQQEFGQIVCQSSETLLALIDDILDYSKIESQRLELEQKPFDLRQCARDAIAMLTSLASERGLTVRYTVDSQVPQQIVGDPMRLRQILLNLVGNAIKFSEQGDIVLSIYPHAPSSIRAVSSSASGESDTNPIAIEFAIRDRGIGIPEHRLDSLFDSFTQVDASTTRRYGGTGLGLAICKRLSELMGGAIWVKSELGCGSTFFFTIAAPLAVSASSITHSSGTSFVPTLDRLASPPPARLLVVEDNSINQKVASNMLRKLGYASDIASNGIEAIAALRARPYDLVFMDVQMPEMDGLEATRRIRKDFAPDRQPHIVAMTANAMRGDRDRCLAAGMDDYISKPVRPEDLTRVLQDYLPSPSSRPVSESAIPPASVIDFTALERLREAVGGDDAEDFLAEVIAEFLNCAPQNLTGIRVAIASQDRESYVITPTPLNPPAPPWEPLNWRNCV